MKSENIQQSEDLREARGGAEAWGRGAGRPNREKNNQLHEEAKARAEEFFARTGKKSIFEVTA